MQPRANALLLFNDECAVCRSLADWVRASASGTATTSALIVQPIGDDPDALRTVNAELDIWDAYAVIHLVMPDGSMKLGGEAVAEVLRRLPNCRWFAWLFAVGFAKFRPFQWMLDLGYTILAKARPILGCESCGTPSPWMRFARAVFARARGKPIAVGKHAPHFTVKPLSRA